jgi:hypothetical protein
MRENQTFNVPPPECNSPKVIETLLNHFELYHLYYAVIRVRTRLPNGIIILVLIWQELDCT